MMMMMSDEEDGDMMSNPLMMMMMMGGMEGGGMDPMMMMMLLMNQMGSDSDSDDDTSSIISNPMLMMSLLGGGMGGMGGMGGLGGPGGGINPMTMLMLANMGREGKTDPALKEYLDKSWEKGKRQLSVGVNYGSVPGEFGFLQNYYNYPDPSMGSFMGSSSLQNMFPPSGMGSQAVPPFPQM